jgi:hypothetical protein
MLLPKGATDAQRSATHARIGNGYLAVHATLLFAR